MIRAVAAGTKSSTATQYNITKTGKSVIPFVMTDRLNELGKRGSV